MRTFRSTPHSATGETPNFLMHGREVRLPDTLVYEKPAFEEELADQYAQRLVETMELAHSLARQRQWQAVSEDSMEPPIYVVGDLVWLENRRRRKGENPKLQSKYVGPYQIVEAYDNHTYLIQQGATTSVQSEKRLKLFKPCPDPAGQAPLTKETHRRPEEVAQGARRRRDSGETLRLTPFIPPRLGPADPTPPEVAGPTIGDAQRAVPNGPASPVTPSMLPAEPGPAPTGSTSPAGARTQSDGVPSSREPEAASQGRPARSRRVPAYLQEHYDLT